MCYCIGIDLGGTNIAGGIADLDGKLLLTDSIKTGLPCPASDIADRIALLCRRMATALGLALSDAAWVGIGALPPGASTARAQAKGAAAWSWSRWAPVSAAA